MLVMSMGRSIGSVDCPLLPASALINVLDMISYQIIVVIMMRIKSGLWVNTKRIDDGQEDST